MEYIISLSTQAKGFLFSLGFGLIMGIVYDVIRIIRLSFTKSKAALIVADFLYVILCSLASFLFMLTVTDGQIRSFIIIGELTGFFIYYFTFGFLAVKITSEAIDKIKVKAKSFLLLVLKPFRKIFDSLHRKITAFSKKTSKKSKKLTKNAKYLLHYNRTLLYNLTDKTHIFSRLSEKEKEKNIMSNTAQKKENKKRIRKYSFFLMIGLLVLVGYFVVSLINNNMEIKSKKKELAQLNAKYEAQLDENQEIQKVIDGGNQDEYIEKVAREKLGYVKPGEKVYYNVTPSN